LEQAVATAAALVRWKRHYLLTPGGQPLKSNQEESDPLTATIKGQSQEEASKDCSNSAMLVALNEPKSLRFSLYEKFVRKYEFAYNQQDIQDLVQMVILPCTSPFFIRQNKLWSKRVVSAVSGSGPNTQPVSDTSTATTACQYLVVQDTTFVGVATLSSVFHLIFTSLPDCVITYQQSRIRFIPNEGTFVYTPFTFFCTVMIPEQDLQKLSAVSSSNGTEQQQKENRKRKFSEASSSTQNNNRSPCLSLKTMKMVALEATGWNIIQFDLNNIIVFKQDNFFFRNMTGMEPYSVSDVDLWNYVFKK
jgi:hypothetical protein